MSEALGDRLYLTGEGFTFADAYLFTIMNWHSFIDLDLAPSPILTAYQARVAARPALRKAMQEEGLLADVPA